MSTSAQSLLATPWAHERPPWGSRVHPFPIRKLRRERDWRLGSNGERSARALQRPSEDSPERVGLVEAELERVVSSTPAFRLFIDETSALR